MSILLSKRQRTSLLLSAVMAALLVGLSGSASPVSARFGPCDGDHGMYTDRLCDGDHLHPGSYIYSPGGQYRLYYGGDGHVYIADTFEDPWVTICSMVPIHENPGKFMWTENSSHPTHKVGWEVIAGPEDEVIDFFVRNVTPVGQSYLTLLNDGLVVAFDEVGGLNAFQKCIL